MQRAQQLREILAQLQTEKNRRDAKIAQLNTQIEDARCR